MHQNTLPSPKTFSLRVLHTASVLRIESQDGSRKCIIDLTKMDAVSPTPEEQRIVYGLEDAPMGIWRNEELTLEECRTLGGLRDRINKQFPPAPPTPVPPPTPTTVPSVPAPTPTPVPPPTVASTASDPLEQFRNALVSHIVNEDDSGFRSKRSRVAKLSRRKRKASKPGNELLELTQAERARLRTCKQWMRFGYDIGTHLQAKVGNFYRLVHGIGVRYRLSELLIPEDALQIPAFAAMLAYWESLAEEGLEYDIDYVDPRSQKKSKEIAINKEVMALRKAHTSLLECLESATKRFEKEWKELPPEATEKDRFAVLNDRDCSIRNHLRKAAEMIKNSIQSAEIFDITGETEDCRKALILAQRARAEVFNVYAGRRGITLAPLPENITMMDSDD